MEKIPFGDLHRHYLAIQRDIDAAIERVLKSGWFVLGREGERFEQEFARFLGGGYAAGVGSGTEALHLALVACDFQPGDQVLTVANTAVPTINAISFAGLEPVFVDIDPESYCIDASRLESSLTPRTRAIVPVHLFGNVCEMETITAFAEKHGLVVIEDACQAHGASYRGRRAGTIGRFGCFSFYPSKNLGAFGDGGLVYSSDPSSVERIRLLRNYGQVRRYHHQIEGFNSRLDEMQAAILSAQLPYLEKWNERRRQIAGLYERSINHPLISKPRQQPDRSHVFHLYVIRCAQRDRLRTHLESRGIGTQIHYPVPCHLQNAYRRLGLRPGSFPVAEKYADEILSLPIYPELDDEQVLSVAEAINQFA